MKKYYQVKIYLPDFGFKFNNEITANFDNLDDAKYLINKYYMRLPISYDIIEISRKIVSFGA